MLDCAVSDEPSMEAILAEVRRLILRDEAARRAPPMLMEKGESILLTQMLAANGSVVSIAPGTNAHTALRPMMRKHDPFADIEALQNEVSALLGPGALTRPGARNDLPKKNGEAADRASHDTTMPLEALNLEPIVADAERAGAARAVSLVEPAAAPVQHCAAGAGEVLDPSAQIERMLAHQMAAAHEVAMMLTNAAVEQIQAESAGGGERLAQSRGRARALGGQRRGHEAARLADTAVRMMQAYNTALDTLMAFGGDTAASMAKRGRKARNSRASASMKAPRETAPRPHRGRKAAGTRARNRKGCYPHAVGAD
jgi:hypothetical protein